MKKSLDYPAAEQGFACGAFIYNYVSVFLRQAIAEGIRLDSRTAFECRDVRINVVKTLRY